MIQYHFNTTYYCCYVIVEQPAAGQVTADIGLIILDASM